MRIDRVKFIAELARRDIKAKDIAESAGVSRATVSAIRGGKTIAPDTAQKIAAALNVPVEKLVEGATV